MTFQRPVKVSSVGAAVVGGGAGVCDCGAPQAEARVAERTPWGSYSVVAFKEAVGIPTVGHSVHGISVEVTIPRSEPKGILADPPPYSGIIPACPVVLQPRLDIHLPPLRERLEDLPLLIQHFLARSAHAPQARRLSEEALRLLLHYPWPGNVRALENTLERALVLSKAIST